ncbi:MAG: NHL repeat-containing protein [Nitrospirae bacterium]|nr:NHL repeat-containing protein [Nitrospirota bacterium]
MSNVLPYNILRIRSFIFLIVASFFFSTHFASPAYGIRLTNVKHLFDITSDFKEPSDVSVSRDGFIYVVDGVNNKIKVFNQSGKFIFSFGKKGGGNGEFNFPLGIDIDSTGRVYVADSGNHRVQAFNSTGGFLGQIKISSKSGRPADPTDVAIDESGNKLYVADNNNHYILVYSLATGQLIDTYGSPGEGEREFRYPFLMDLDKHNYLFVADVINTRVQVLNPEGRYVTSIGGWGVEKGEFFRPKGVALDDDKVYVSDSYMGVIQVFRSSGEFYSAVGDASKGTVRRFTTPVGLFIDGKNKRLYVVEMFAERVSVYGIGGESE